MCQRLVGDVFHIRVKSLKFFELVSEYSLSNTRYVSYRTSLSHTIKTGLRRLGYLLVLLLGLRFYIIEWLASLGLLFFVLF